MLVKLKVGFGVTVREKIKMRKKAMFTGKDKWLW